MRLIPGYRADLAIFFPYVPLGAMLIDMSLRYIKMHFSVSPTDRSGAPVNLAFERAAFSNYRSNY